MGAGTAQTTLDGVRVTPADDSTAAIYQYLPTVAEGAPGGTWLFWNLWKKYATALNYAGAGGVVTPTASIGDGCTVSGDCGYPGGVCATNYPGGSARPRARASVRPTRPAGPRSAPTSSSRGATASPSATRAHRPAARDTRCEKVAQYGDATVGQYVCSP